MFLRKLSLLFFSFIGLASAADIDQSIIFREKYGFLTRTFFSDFDESIVSLRELKNGAQWFGNPLFGRCYSKFDFVSNSISHLNLAAGYSDCDGRGIVNISSIAVIDKKNSKWLGRAFGGGGYFEASLKFEPNNTINLVGDNPQWPAFWAISLEHVMGLPGERRKGDENVQFPEIDVFEYVTQGFAGKYSYGATVHHWYGEYKKTCAPKGYCSVNNTKGGGSQFENAVVKYPKNFDFENFHRYGVLWVPAQKKRSGFLEFFLDGKSTGVIVSWKHQRDGDSPHNNPFSAIDQQHLIFIFSTGIQQPMQIRDFQVWQKNESQNIEMKK